MKKNIAFGLMALCLLSVGAITAGSHTASSTDTICPDRPGCICSKPQVTDAGQRTGDAKGVCPNTPTCICD